MTDQSLSKSQVMEAIAAGNSDDLYFQRVQLNTTDDCTLNCGVPGTLSLEGRFVGSWPNYNNTEVVLDLRDVRFETRDGTRTRGEALAYVRTNPPTPKQSVE